MNTTEKANSRAHRANAKFRDVSSLHPVWRAAKLWAEAEAQHGTAVVLVKDGKVTDEGWRRGIKL